MQTQTGPNILIVAQAGRLTYEAVLFAASLRASDPEFSGTLTVAEPAPGPLWPNDPRIRDDSARMLLGELGATIRAFDCHHFAAAYPHGNKVEALYTLPKGEPFVFFDTDTLITGPLSSVAFDFARPAASMQREGTWPKIELYGPGFAEIWGSLYDRLGLDFAASLDETQPDEHWERYLYFNAGWFFGPCPHAFADRMIDVMTSIRDDRPAALVCQEIYPWLDQIALPLVIHEMGGGRPNAALDGLDGNVSAHWRILPLFYATANEAQITFLETIAAPNKIKKVLKEHEPFKRMIYQGRGQKARALFDQNALPARQAAIRNRLKSKGFWMR
ncbi:MAG: hypothetical protein AAFN59_05180 [Pseudomonadota bacterium]